MKFINAHILSILFIFALNLLLQVRTRKLPLHPDSGLFLYRAILSRTGEKFRYGKRTGKGVFDFSGDYSRFQIKFLVYKIMEVLYRVTSPNPKAFRVFFAFYNSFSTLAVYALGSLAFGWATGLLSAILFVLLSANPFSDSHQIHAEHYAVLPLLTAILLLLLGIRENSLLSPFLSGMFMAVTVFLFKITFLFELPALLALPLLLHAPLYDFPFFFGFAALLCIVYMGCWYFDTLPSFYAMLNIFTSRDIFKHYKNSMKSDLQKATPLRSFSPDLILKISSGSLPFLFLVCLMFLLGFPPGPLEIFILLWALLSVFGIVMQGKYFQAHLFPLFAPLALMGGRGLSSHFSTGFPYGYSIPQILLLILTIGFFLFWLRDLFRFHLLFSPLQYHIEKCAIRNYQTLSFLATEPIAAYIRRQTPRGARILQWGYHHELYVLAGRRGSLGPHLENSLQTDPPLSDAYFGPVWRQWLLDAVAKQRPLFIVDMRGSLNIDCLNLGTGLHYELENLFYGLFPVYKLSSQVQRPSKSIVLNDLTVQPPSWKARKKDLTSEEFITRINYLFNHGERDAANRETHGGVEALLRDWTALNT